MPYSTEYAVRHFFMIGHKMSHSPGSSDLGKILSDFFPKVQEAIKNTASVITRDNPIRPTKSNSDPYSTTAVTRQDLSKTNSVQLGIIAEALPFWGWYKVISFNGGYSIACNYLSDVPQSPMGARRIGSLQPQTKVHFIRPHNSSYGTIIGIDPEVMPNTADVLPEIISMASNFKATDEYTNRALYTYDKNCLADFSRGSPLDSTLAGERGWVCETGTSIFVDSFMAFVKADENCGFWAFHMDQLARMHGHNIQIRSCSYEQEHFTDSAEATGYIGMTPYPWEGLGALTLSTATAQISEGTGFTDVASNIGLETQMPYHRLQTYTGYLGQGIRQVLRLPPESEGIYNLGQRGGDITWEQHLALDGNYHIRSSQGITIAHSPLYRSPARSARMEDQQNGDTKDNYKFAGAVGSGQAHKINDTPIKSKKFAARALTSDDDVAYSFAWRNEHPFVYHEKDFLPYETPDEEATPTYSQLSGQWYIDPPGTIKKKVDHRYEAEYNNLMSYFKIMPDGTIVIAGPNGEEIRMVGGSIEISCPGDIQLRPGRNLISMAGRSTCLRSKEDIDISSTDADVRVKAEKNLMVLGGNSKGQGEFILESKSTIGKGIVLRSASSINALAVDDVYIRSGADGSSKNIVIDAGSGGNGGAGDVCISGSRVSAFLVEGRYDFFGTDSSYDPSNAFTPTGAVIGSPLYAKGTIANLGALICRDYIISTEAHIATARSKDFSGFVGDLSKDTGDGTTAAQKADEELNKIAEYVEQINALGSDIQSALISARFTESGKIGDADVAGGWGASAFRFKSTGEYKATGFTLYETRWQQRDRLFSGEGVMWSEKSVDYLGDPTYPYPGATAWTVDPSLKEVDLKFYDLKPAENIEDKINEGDENGIPPDGNYRIVG